MFAILNGLLWECFFCMWEDLKCVWWSQEFEDVCYEEKRRREIPRRIICKETGTGRRRVRRLVHAIISNQKREFKKLEEGDRKRRHWFLEWLLLETALPVAGKGRKGTLGCQIDASHHDGLWLITGFQGLKTHILDSPNKRPGGTLVLRDPNLKSRVRNINMQISVFCKMRGAKLEVGLSDLDYSAAPSFLAGSFCLHQHFFCLYSLPWTWSIFINI